MNFLICNAIFLYERVTIGTLEHIFPVILAFIFNILLICFSKYKLNKSQQEKTIFCFSVLISLTVIVFHVYKISKGNYTIANDLPLYLCSLLGLLIPVFAYYRKYWMYEILLFWIIGGTLQAVLTPDIPFGFPNFDYFRYWIVHLGLLTVIFYVTFVFNFRPKLKSVFKSFFALQVYVIAIVVINYTLNANYFYLNEKPKSASLLDFFGEWPIYIIVVQLIVIPLFLLIYLPFYLSEKNYLANN
jgi:hypothetical integral membrane protein (TIGR02206 family)